MGGAADWHGHPRPRDRGGALPPADQAGRTGRQGPAPGGDGPGGGVPRAGGLGAGGAAGGDFRAFLDGSLARALGCRRPDLRAFPRLRHADPLHVWRPEPAGGSVAGGGLGALLARFGAMIELSGLTKRYGRFTAVDGISLTIPAGALVGFLGPNGAGKTTTFRMIAGILKPTSGSIRIAGISLDEHPIAAKSRLGFIPDRPFVYDKLTGAEFLRFVAALYGQEEFGAGELVVDE